MTNKRLEQTTLDIFLINTDLNQTNIVRYIYSILVMEKISNKKWMNKK